MSNAAFGKESKAEMTDSQPPEQRDEKEQQQRSATPETNAEMSDPYPPNVRNEKEQEEWYERTRYQILLFAIGITLFVIVGALVLDWYIDPKTSTQKKDLAQALGLITAGVAGAVGIFFTWRGQRLAREAQEHNQTNTQEQLRLTRQSQAQNQQSTQAQLENAQEELRLTRQGQMTERFTQAVDQLGSDKLEIKLGGIYSLERTAQEEKNYHWPVMEVLTSYVRRHAARKPEEESGENAAAPPEPDIQAILDVIGRRSKYHRTDKEVEYGTIELHDTDLRGADLEGAHLEAADLAGADLRVASLAGAHLQHAIVEDADLRGANLMGADLRNVYFMDTHLQDAVLNEADLRAADLSRATGLTQEEQLDNALGDSDTVIPHGLQRPALWALEINEQRIKQRQLFEEALEELGIAEAEQHPPDEHSNEDE